MKNSAWFGTFVGIGLATLLLPKVGFGQATKATGAASSPNEVLLRYKLSQGQIIESEVVHLAKTDTKIEATDQSSQSRSISKKIWEVTKVQPDGTMTFVLRVEEVDMSQQIGDAEEVHYNSAKDKEPPAMFKNVAESLKKPIATITISPRGEIQSRDDKSMSPTLGMGDVTLTFPEKAMSIGSSWEVPREIRVRLEDGGTKVIKIRELYTLEKFSAGVATISVASEPITPYDDPKIEAQVVQQLSNGKIKFDVDAGRLISKELQWNEKVVGFSGPGSMMNYAARYSEETKDVKSASTARKVGKIQQRR